MRLYTVIETRSTGIAPSVIYHSTERHAAISAMATALLDNLTAEPISREVDLARWAADGWSTGKDGELFSASITEFGAVVNDGFDTIRWHIVEIELDRNELIRAHDAYTEMYAREIARDRFVSRGYDDPEKNFPEKFEEAVRAYCDTLEEGQDADCAISALEHVIDEVEDTDEDSININEMVESYGSLSKAALVAVMAFLDGKNFSTYVYTEDGRECGIELSGYTAHGVNMIHFIDLRDGHAVDFFVIIDEICEIANNFDVDEEVEVHIQNKSFKQAFSYGYAAQEFADYEEFLRGMADDACALRDRFVAHGLCSEDYEDYSDFDGHLKWAAKEA